MGCSGCLSEANIKAGERFIACFRVLLGIGENDGKWDELAHQTLYRALSTVPMTVSAREMTSEDFAAIPWQSEPTKTAQYVVSMISTYAASSENRFWECLGINRDDAFRQMSAGAGIYYDHLRAGMTQITNAESGRAQTDSGGPSMIVWLALIGATLLGGYALYKWLE